MNAVNVKQKGFTLIELVMVIVILGILAAFALPRFADLSGEAETATVEAARGSVKSAVGIVRSKALATNTTSGTVDLEGATGINIVNGHLAGSSLTDAAQLSDFAVEGDSSPYIITVDPAADTQPCFTYTDAGTDGTPSVSDIQDMDGTGTCGTTDAGT